MLLNPRIKNWACILNFQRNITILLNKIKTKLFFFLLQRTPPNPDYSPAEPIHPPSPKYSRDHRHSYHQSSYDVSFFFYYYLFNLYFCAIHLHKQILVIGVGCFCNKLVVFFYTHILNTYITSFTFIKLKRRKKKMNTNS